MSIFITGDIHGEFTQILDIIQFSHIKSEDYLIVCGDFGIWDQTNVRKLQKMAFSFDCTVLFVDGNHENFNMLNAFEVVDYHGGNAHKIADNIYHLMRGEIFEIEGKTFLAMGGAASHDISDGILDPDNRYFSRNRRRLEEQGKYNYRVKGRSWWPEEMPSLDEYSNARFNLVKRHYEVDYILTHCAPTRIQTRLDARFEPDKLTDFLNEVFLMTDFKHWYCGHYHRNQDFIDDKFTILYGLVRKVED